MPGRRLCRRASSRWSNTLLLQVGAATAAFLAPWLATEVHPAGVGVVLSIVAAGVWGRAHGHRLTGTPVLVGGLTTLVVLLGVVVEVLV